MVMNNLNGRTLSLDSRGRV